MTAIEPTDTAPAEIQPKISPADRLKPYRWQKGQSGNPGGRPKGQSVTAFLRDMLDMDIVNRKTGVKIALSEALARSGIKHALNGSFQHWREILDRTEGKVTERHEHLAKVASVVEVTPEMEAIAQRITDQAIASLRPEIVASIDAQTDDPQTRTLAKLLASRDHAARVPIDNAYTRALNGHNRITEGQS